MKIESPSSMSSNIKMGEEKMEREREREREGGDKTLCSIRRVIFMDKTH